VRRVLLQPELESVAGSPALLDLCEGWGEALMKKTAEWRLIDVIDVVSGTDLKGT
jgi:hypothetical protein